jgi:RimJ/RimL family protein N-acetyltransferase
VAGNIVCFEDQGERLVGYWIGRGFWGLGIATAALAAFLRQIPARPLVARVVRHNVASRRVLEKCGFMLAGEDNDELILTLAAVMREGVVSSRCSGVATKLGLLRHHLRTQ